MVGEISARHALSKEVIEGVSERTGGVPLFVEEVTRLLLERGEQGGVQAIPPTLQQAGATGRRATEGAAAPSRGLTQLHVAYGNALMAARGFGAPETTEAFARAREKAYGENAALERLALRPMGRQLRARLAREHELPMWRAFGVFLEGWATAVGGVVGSGLEDMRRGIEQLREQNVLNYDGLLKIALAEAEARAGDPDR